MKTFLIGGLVLGLLAPVSALAQSPFDGTWKGEVSSAHPSKKPNVYLLQDGNYECKTCVPLRRVKADGADHAITGSPYFDSEAVKVIDDHTVQVTNKKNGKIVATVTTTIAPDGKTATLDISDSSGSTTPVIVKATRTRVSSGPAGAHAISGSWRTTAYSSVSDNATTFSYKADGDSLTMTNGSGQGYTAKMDGTDAPYTGDPGTTDVSVRKLGERAIEETDKRAGKVIQVTTSTVSPDGKTMSVTMHDKERGTIFAFTANKQ